MTKHTEFYGDFDFTVISSPEFKEDSVREEIISPLLKSLGYAVSGINRIVRSKALAHPFVRIGSKKQKISIFPDYLLTVSNKPAWVLDAKAPAENITSGHHVEQAYSYAIHPEVRVRILALCNGRELSVFSTDNATALLHTQLTHIDEHWAEIYDLLSPSAFYGPMLGSNKRTKSQAKKDYSSIRPLEEIRDLRKQSARRHYGVHPYFTKQVWNVVQEYIDNFTSKGDLVLDPFGGSGVTLVESLVLDRKAIHVDINPLANFMVASLIQPVKIGELVDTYNSIKSQFIKSAPRTTNEVERALSKYWFPKGVLLPSSSDVDTVEQLFSREQLAQLAFLRHLILNVDHQAIKDNLLLMFSALLNKINLTYHASGNRSEGRGDSSAFRYYRYRIAPNPASLDIIKYMDLRLQKTVAAKNELTSLVSTRRIDSARIVHGSATDLSFIKDRSVDYIYTDPPYGSKIQYLDLSTMWNAWLDLPVSRQDYQLEAIEGGELEKTRDDYSGLLTKSIEEMFRVLKYDRWMSFVFAHKDPAYWHLIVESAENVGFEYMGAVPQSNNKTTFKKRQNPFTVLSGQLIINFRKTKNPRSVLKVELGADVAELIIETIEGVIARNHGATLEEINDEVIIKGLELGFLDLLSEQYQDISPLLNQNFLFDEDTKKYQIRPNAKLRSRIDVRVRIRYYLLSYLRRMVHKSYNPTFDEIVLNIMPLLKNGVTPRKQTIESVLESLATRTHDGRWKLSNSGQLDLL